MKLRSNIFLRGILTHCYQRTVDGYLIFYTIEDFLLFYTLLCTIAPKYRIRIYKVTLMPDHYHLVLTAECFEDLAHFIAELTSRFTKAQNVELQRKGALFEGPFGFSLKKQEKDARSAFIYADNNPVERKLCERAEQYRWTFLAYAQSDHPFSRKICRSHERKAFRQMLDGVDRLHANRQPTSYRFLQYQFSRLTAEEKPCAVDYIISKYRVMDFDAVIKFFGSYERMLMADHTTTGSEHDLKEVFVGRDDKVYRQLSILLLRMTGIRDLHEVLRLPMEKRRSLFHSIRCSTSLPVVQIAKYLRIPRASSRRN